MPKKKPKKKPKNYGYPAGGTGHVVSYHKKKKRKTLFG